MSRFLKLTDLLQPEHFPVQIIEGESPDYLLRYSGIEHGVEIMEICYEEEQKRLTKVDKDQKSREGPCLQTSIPWDFDEKFTKLARAFHDTLEQHAHKRKSYYDSSCILVCYLNSLLFSERLLEALIESFKEMAEKSSHGFSDIYVYKEDELYLL